MERPGRAGALPEEQPYTYVDPDGVSAGVEDVVSSAREHHERVGLSADLVYRSTR